MEMFVPEAAICGEGRENSSVNAATGISVALFFTVNLEYKKRFRLNPRVFR